MSLSISRRSILATSGISAAALALAACGSSDDGKPAGGSGSAEGVLKVGVEGVYKPYNFHDDSGKLVGFEIDIVEAIAEKIGKKVQYVEAKWDSLLAGLDAGQYDVVMNNVAVTDERKKAFDLTVPYAQTQGRLGGPEGSDITSLADVKGRRAAQTTTSNWGQVMTDAGAEIVASPGFAESVELVSTGRADVTANEVVAFDTYLEEHPDAPIKVLDEKLETEVLIAGALKKGSPLIEKINKAITELLDDGTIAKIDKDWLGLDLTPKN